MSITKNPTRKKEDCIVCTIRSGSSIKESCIVCTILSGSISGTTQWWTENSKLNFGSRLAPSAVENNQNKKKSNQKKENYIVCTEQESIGKLLTQFCLGKCLGEPHGEMEIRNLVRWKIMVNLQEQVCIAWKIFNTVLSGQMSEATPWWNENSKLNFGCRLAPSAVENYPRQPWREKIPQNWETVPPVVWSFDILVDPIVKLKIKASWQFCK